MARPQLQRERGRTQASLAFSGKASVSPHRTGAGRAPSPPPRPPGLSITLLPGVLVLPFLGRGHSLAKGEVAVEPLRKLGDPGTPRPATPGVP